jgi:protein-L-isoaspartate(D-aspartate) O-methyltransferase
MIIAKSSILLLFVLFLGLISTASFQPFLPPTPPPVPMPTSSTVLLSAASRFGGSVSQRNLVSKLQREGVISQKEAIAAMNQVDRRNYVMDAADMYAYADTPQGIECGQTISAPHMHAYAMEELVPFLRKCPRDAVKILDVGCGSGYLTATLGRLVHKSPHEPMSLLGKTGTVYGMDVYPRLVDLTRENIQRGDGDLLESGTVQLKVGNGWDGWPEAAPFDAIHVGAAASTFPKVLANQLAVGGVMVIPIGPEGGFQNFYRVERIAQTGNVDSDFQSYKLLGVRYVPLVHAPRF